MFSDENSQLVHLAFTIIALYFNEAFMICFEVRFSISAISIEAVT